MTRNNYTSGLIRDVDSVLIYCRRLFEKNEKIQGYLSALGQNEENQEEAIQELEELITPAEKDLINRLKTDLAR